jgi:hypothetical protein
MDRGRQRGFALSPPYVYAWRRLSGDETLIEEAQRTAALLEDVITGKAGKDGCSVELSIERCAPS